ncbi:ground-like domain protein [Teladorsagia circumcincta]|uniref:Ground-like domain protein n=1 Tax=Teladorsagia circumcincta TaxID=45464 RepID=A0A2G9ULM6_TELCI|nr:ground-like domain protein [Teladorsagia circumcincta]
MVIPMESTFFGGGMGGGMCCGGGGGGCGGRKKRSTEDMEQDRSLADHSDKLCNNPELKRFIQKNMAADPKTSKKNLVNALYPEDDHFFVVCTTGDSLYSAPRTSTLCSSTSFKHTCYVFGI